ncbi:MAG: efflux RND transporter periplasmic adaptor subunit [Armatimonadetes bacterium]|nr:efflux RND transporter periplasmic adaptor subunit [Armatimonadota bacterium]NIM24586.1 efflux RND transporter periplasmic adaptor subunit [Armatimonadota bacterium]NIM68462.1 efflux RND transporter periplasmic adaptor subunit [Armatimonadota bacterium]NIM76848.1 efflux RND transporter periplasmic adaptor subunit [Armatimonadota bacterium]NIN06659.1 efflux RND transporter periplasmic adaptor subunit [Armatimonadota bacterium]
MRTKAGVALVIIVVVTVVCFIAWPRHRRSSERTRRLPTSEVEAADFRITLRLLGNLKAMRTHPLVCELERGNIVWAVKDGSLAKAGDLIVRLDSAEFEEKSSKLQKEVAEGEDHVRKVEDEAEKKVQSARVTLTKAEEALRLVQSQNEASLEKARAEIAFQEKELEVTRGQLDRQKRLAEERLVAVTEVESAEEEVRKSEFSLEKARRALTQAEKDAAAQEKLRKIDIEKAQLDLAEAETAGQGSVKQALRDLAVMEVELEDAEREVADAEIRAPAVGLVLLAWHRTGEKLRVGDEVHMGQRIATVIDPAKMEAQCDIGETQIEQIEVGQEATVVVTALGNTRLRGVVKAISNLAQERFWWEGGAPGKKVFAALIELKEADKRLRPGMGVTVEIEVEEVKQGLAIPVEAVFSENGKQVVYLVRQDRYEKVPVKVGKRSELIAVVEGELKAGDKVACRRPHPSRLIAVEVPK